MTDRERDMFQIRCGQLLERARAAEALVAELTSLLDAKVAQVERAMAYREACLRLRRVAKMVHRPAAKVLSRLRRAAARDGE